MTNRIDVIGLRLRMPLRGDRFPYVGEMVDVFEQELSGDRSPLRRESV